MTSQRKLDMVGTWSTVGKRAKRKPDITVETTDDLILHIQRDGKMQIWHSKFSFWT